MTGNGKLYGGRYRVQEAIASGGMAEVFVARDELLGRKVALKLLQPELARDRSFRERFRREAQAAASLNDPGIVSVYDWGADEGDYYLIMEYVEGSTLRDVIKDEGHMEQTRAAEIAADICAALNVAHQKGIVHRDVKPANIAITPGGQTKVMDFGISRAETDDGHTVTQAGMVMGTAKYFSPEQAQGMPVDARSDLYSVGVILYEMLTGRPPFEGDTPAAIAYKHVSEAPVPASQLVSEVSGDADAIVMKALAKNPDNRYESALDMRSDLKRLMRGDRVEATPILASDPTVALVAGDRTAVLEAAPGAGATRGRRALAYTLIALLFLSVIVLAVTLLFALLGPGGRKVVVPSVVGLPLVEAQRLLSARGLKPVVEPQSFSETVPEGNVISQDPGEEREVEEGSDVKLVVSKGPERVVVPNLIGKSQQEAENLLKESGLEVGAVSSRFDKTVEAGTVLDQTPNSGQRVDRGSSVDLVLSGGKELVRVPRLTGLSENEAKERIADAKLKAQVVEACNTGRANDEVMSQDPAPGEEVAEGSVVTITVNRAPKIPSVLNQTEAAATKELEDLGFKVEVLRETAPGKTGRVIKQDPDAGERACKGDTVTITVAN